MVRLTDADADDGISSDIENSNVGHNSGVTPWITYINILADGGCEFGFLFWLSFPISLVCTFKRIISHGISYISKSNPITPIVCFEFIEFNISIHTDREYNFRSKQTHHRKREKEEYRSETEHTSTLLLTVWE